MMQNTDGIYSPIECQAFARLLERKYAAYLRDRHFEVSLRVSGDTVHGQVTLRNDSGSFFYPVEGQIGSKSQGLSPREAAEALFDFIDLYFDEFLRSDGDVFLPIDWADFQAEGVQLQLKGQVHDLVLEKLADDLLEGRDMPASLPVTRLHQSQI